MGIRENVAEVNSMKSNNEPEASVVMKAMQYTVEPGFPECGRIIDEHRGGGLGSMPPTTKYFDFVDNERSPLIDFLETLSCVEGDYASYCTASSDEVRKFIGEYLGEFLNTSKYGAAVTNQIVEHLQKYPMRRGYFKCEEYRECMVMGTRFFNDFYYDSALMVAAELFPYELHDNCLSAFAIPLIMKGTFGGIDGFVNRFSANPKYRFYTDLPNSEFRAVFGANMYDDMGKGPAFYCSLHDYENYLRPYILFLSNWSLLLGTYLAVLVFGQCAFTVCWEHPMGFPLPSFRPGRKANSTDLLSKVDASEETVAIRSAPISNTSVSVPMVAPFETPKMHSLPIKKRKIPPCKSDLTNAL